MEARLPIENEICDAPVNRGMTKNQNGSP